MAEAAAGKRRIRIGVQKPTLVLGSAAPLDTVNRWLDRHYQYGPARNSWIIAGVAAVSFASFVILKATNAAFVVLPKTVTDKGWAEATEKYRREQHSIAVIKEHKIGQPVPPPPKPSKYIQ